MKNKALFITSAAAAAVGSALFYYTFTKWIIVPYLFSVALYALAAGCLAARFAEKKPLLRGVPAGVIFAAGFCGLTFLINM